MATKWTKNVTREVETDAGAVAITITKNGVEVRKKGTRRAVTLNVDQLILGGECEIAPEKRHKWFWK